MKKLSILMLLTLAISIQAFSQTEEEEKRTLKPALLILDVQNQYLPMMSESDQEDALEMMNWAIWVFRKHDLPIINIYHTDEKWGPEPGTEEFEFHESLKIDEGDPKVTKTYGSGFNKTDLDKILKEKDVNTVFICGLSSVGCALATYFDAKNYDYTSFLIKDALLSHDADYTKQVEEIFEAVDLNLVNYMMEIKR